MVGIDSSSLYRWFGVRIDSCLALFYIYQMKLANSYNGYHDDSTTNSAQIFLLTPSARSASGGFTRRRCPFICLFVCLHVCRMKCVHKTRFSQKL